MSEYKLIGPGIWHELHNEAALATSLFRYGVFVHTLETIHAAFELVAPPVPAFSDHLALLKWTWAYHNQVNGSNYPWRDCLKTYGTADQECDVFCTEEETETPIKIVGPGMWFIIHAEGARVRNSYGHAVYTQHMLERSERFPCGACRGHFTAYMQAHPLSEVKPNGVDILHWSFKFHNAVNARLGKNCVTWGEIVQKYCCVAPPLTGHQRLDGSPK